MPLNAEKQKPVETDVNPLDALAALVADDMRDVNGLIIDRMHSDVALIPQLAAYLIAAGGKRIRPLLTLATAKLFGADVTPAHRLAAAVEFIHTATLLHDDVVDESKERRGNPAANLIFGNKASVLVGDFLFSRAFQLMVESNSIDVLRILSEASAVIAEGEVLQLSTANNLDTTLEDYLKVIEAKTAALFAAACEVGAVAMGQDRATCDAVRAYGMALGIAFQIADDILDYTADSAQRGKERGDDFRDGKITAPIIYAYGKGSTEERQFWARCLVEQDIRDGDLDHAIGLLNSHGALEWSLELARDYARNACDSLNAIAAGELLQSLAHYAVSRRR